MKRLAYNLIGTTYYNTDPGHRKGRKSNLLLEPDTERRGKELFNKGEGVLGNRLGDPKA